MTDTEQPPPASVDPAGLVEQSEPFLTQLRRVNTERYHAWVGEGEEAGILFDATELGGEVGELLNVVKKLEREERGWRGSRAAPEDFADECADVLICLDKLARRRGVDLTEATVCKFNATSEKQGLPHKLAPTRTASTVGEAIPDGMVPWHGGDGAPDDWDENGQIKCRCGDISDIGDHGPWYWGHGDVPADIIAYTPDDMPNDEYVEFDDRDENAEWCDRCQGMGIANCYCGGDQCYCKNYGEMVCPRCYGEGWFVPTPAFLAAHEQNAQWMRELWAKQEAETASKDTPS